MATFKKWMLPSTAIILGGIIGFSLFPSKEDHTYNDWKQWLFTFEKGAYEIESSFIWDQQIYSQGEGIWSSQKSYFQLDTPVSDGSMFSIETYLLENSFFVSSDDQWFTGKRPHNFYHEIAPLDNPFQWVSEILQYADTITENRERESITLTAHFKEFPLIDFRGLLLQKQKDTFVTMRIRNNDPIAIKLVAHPIRPDTVGPFRSYPDQFMYQIKFIKTERGLIPDLPENAKHAQEIE